MIDISNLNNEQQKAVKLLDGPVLCLAGAGSGKTTTLTYRVANLIENGVNPASIILLTFTKKSANDMLLRVNELIGDAGKKVTGGTFHHFASILISKFGDYINIKRNYNILDDNDSIDIIQSIRCSNNNIFQNSKISNSFIFQIISRARSHLKSLNEIINQYYPQFLNNLKDLELLYSLYSKYKTENNLLDYDDLLESLYNLLLNPEIRDIINEHYHYIMIDEYQDTNIIQAKIAKLLASSHNNIMVVGDDSQSIYSFRGSRIENILEFNKTFPNCKTIKLEKNYRSFGYILKGCNSLINKSKYSSIKKELYTDKPDGKRIVLVRCISEKEEASLVVHRILQLYNLGYSLNDIAVLFRNTNYSYELEIELAKRGIPYRKNGGSKIFDSPHIRNIISYLRILNNPYDKISWIRILMLIKGIGIQSATNIYEYLKNLLEPFDLSEYKAKSEIKKQLKKLSNMLISSIKFINKEPIFLLNFILDYYLSLIKEQNHDELQNVIKELDQLSLITEKYKSLKELLSEIFIDNNDGEYSQNDNSNQRMVLTLSTIHSAKGLEWKQVFIISALKGRFPSFNSMKNIDDYEEERRLMYVAMTRAMDGLMITYPSGIWDKTSREFLTEPSPFINDISTDNIELWQIKH